MTIKSRLKMKNRSQIYDTNRYTLRHGRNYKYKMYLSIMMVICIKEHLTKISSFILEKVKQL